jgi:RNA binding exosome subunit
MGKTETEIAKRLRDEAETIRHGIDEIDQHKIMRLLKEAADEADRFYNGMMAWKQTAETKDAKLSQEMTDRINERVAARLAEQTAPMAPVDYRNEVLEEAAEMVENMRWGWDGDCNAAQNIRGMKSTG